MEKSISLKKSLSLYFVSTLIEKGIGFFLIPIITNAIAPAGVGKLALISSVISFLTPLILLNTSAAIYVEYFKKENNTPYKSYFTTSLVINFILFLFFLIISILGISQFASFLECPPEWIIAIPFFCFFDTIKTVTLSLFQIQKKPGLYAIVSLLYSVLNFSLSLLLVYHYKMDYEGRLLGMLVSGILVFFVSIFIFFRTGLLTITINRSSIRDIIFYGAPLLPHSLGYIVLDLSDRFFIKHFNGASDLGIYSVAYLLSGVISILANIFNTSFNPYLYEALAKNTNESNLWLAKVYIRYIVLLLIISILYALCIPLLYALFIDKAYEGGIIYTYPIIAGYFFMSIYQVFANIIFFNKKNYIFGYMAVFNITGNVIMNYFFVMKYGPLGAAFATMISMGLFMIAIIYFSNKMLQLPWKKGMAENIGDLKRLLSN